jgi:hypothetical protein
MKFRKKPIVIEAYQVPHPDPGYQRCDERAETTRRQGAEAERSLRSGENR